MDLRVHVSASRREAAERYRVSPSVVVLWAQRFEQTGSVAAKPSGGSMDNVPVYKVAGVQEAIEAVGARAQRPSTNLTVTHEPRCRDLFAKFHRCSSGFVPVVGSDGNTFIGRDSRAACNNSSRLRPTPLVTSRFTDVT